MRLHLPLVVFKNLFITILLSTLSFTSISQIKGINYELGLQALATSNNTVPFWMRSNQYGSIPLSGVSSSLLASAKKEYDLDTAGYLNKPKLLDWGMGFEGRVNTNISTSQFILTEAYFKGRLGSFELKAGRSKETMGLTGDTTLSSGSFAVSGNALGIPKIQISIPEYHIIPFFDSLFAFKGNFAHGWVGRTQILDKVQVNKSKPPYNMAITNPVTYLHQKSLYLRIGKPVSKLHLLGGFSHQVYWGNERRAYGDVYTIKNAETFLYVISGKPYGNDIIPRSKIGNQIGSIDLALQYKLKHLKILAYRQNLYDVGALYHFANIRDGLNGITLTNTKKSISGIVWEKLLFEFFYSKNQAGELWSKRTPSGDEDYYNNYYYKQGWSYKSLGLGTPFINTRSSVKYGQASNPFDYFINNRVVAFHLGASANLFKWTYETKFSFSSNYGTFGTSAAGKSTGNEFYPPAYGLFKQVNQYDLYIKGSRILNNRLKVSYAAALDRGELLNKTEGVEFMITLKL